MEAHRSAAAAELSRVVELYESIKEVAEGAFQMRLQAYNALVTSRAHGREAPGFEVVAEHMGVMSTQLDHAMAAVSPAVESWVTAASVLLKLERSRTIVRRAHHASGGRAQLLLATAAARVADQRAALSRLQRQLGTELDDVARLTAGGCAVARSARLESAYGGSHRAALGAVASSFATLADRIYESVLRLRQRATEVLLFDEREDGA